MTNDIFTGGNKIADSSASLAQSAAVAIIFFVIVIALWRAKGAVAGLLSALVAGALAWYIVKLGGISDFATLFKNTIHNFFK